MGRGTTRTLQRVQSLDRGLTILYTVANSKRPVSLGELTTVIGINRSSVFRLASTLKRRGFLATPSGQKDYVLGPSMWRLSKEYDWGSMLIQLSQERLKRLAVDANETAHLAVREGLQAHIIDHAEATHVLVVSGQLGSFFELHCSSLGKALLADATELHLRALYGTRPLRAYTRFTLTSIKDLARACAQTRKQGYAVDLGEFRADLRCVAAPIRAADGVIVATIGVSAPVSRFSDVHCRTYGRLVRRAAQDIGEVLKEASRLPTAFSTKGFRSQPTPQAVVRDQFKVTHAR